MVRSPLADVFGQISFGLLVIGVLVGLMVHWLMGLTTIGGILVVLWIFNAIENAAMLAKTAEINPNKRKQKSRKNCNS